MSRLRRALAATAAAIPLLAGVVLAPEPASAAAPDATYTISIGSVNSY